MCGIIGVLANRPAAALILSALKRLEYRGYDSAGLATLDGDGVMRRLRAAGKLGALIAANEATPSPGSIGIGHTRWATHGAPSEANAHPHRAGPVAVVHNGIIENFRELRAELETDGARFESETDTEVVAQLVAREMRRGLGPTDAAASALKRLRGAFALCFLFEGAVDLLVCARRGPPLAIGYGEGEMFIGSDALALQPLTTRVAYLEDGDWAAVTRDGAHVFDADDRPVTRAIRDISLEAASAEKGGYRHFMAKEIHEQPATLAAALGAYVSAERDRVIGDAGAVDWARLSRVTMIACGTAFYACQVGKHWFETIARLPVEIDVASEFRYREPPMPPGGAAIFVSQSGETADTLAALRYARAQGQVIVAVVNVESSTIAREADVVLPLRAGPEIGVASTKAFSGQLVALAATVILAARQRGAIDAAGERRLVTALCAAPAALADALTRETAIARLAAEIAQAHDVLYLGRGAMHALAMEGALKLKELTYIHAEGYAAGELKHGPIALVDERTPVIVLAPTSALSEKTLSNMQEVMARKGRVALISDADGLAQAGDGVWRRLEMPMVDPFIAPIVYAAPVQLLAYHAAVARGTDVDQPRNLAKSVTVE